MSVDVNRFYRAAEDEVVASLLNSLSFTSAQKQRIAENARFLVKKVRQSHHQKSGVDKLMTKYDLSSKEGLALMGLAESLIRVPDQATAYALIEDKLRDVDFSFSQEMSESFVEKTAGKVLGFASKFLSTSDNKVLGPLKSSLQKASKPVVSFTSRKVLNQLANQFVMGANIEDAYKKVPTNLKAGYSHSFDMLGEEAHTRADAKRYFESYLQAIKDIGERESAMTAREDMFDSVSETLKSSISVKLSALHPRYEESQRHICIPELTDLLKILCLEAKARNIDLTVDAEESERLDMSLEIFAHVAKDPDLKGWGGLGLAVQAYQKRAVHCIDFLQVLAKESHRQIKVRLVKGAYWDTEIKNAQVLGLDDYPVFTRKQSTDLSYLVCAKKLLADPKSFSPKFATHNAHTVAAILELANGQTHFEFQCLYGMGQALYEEVLKNDFTPAKGVGVRIYAPVGEFRDLLPYLVRRLLENGANTSFVNEITKTSHSIDDLISDPIEEMRVLDKNQLHNPQIPLPAGILPGRLNALGLDVTSAADMDLIFKGQNHVNQLANDQKLIGQPIVSGKRLKHRDPKIAKNPANDDAIGKLYFANGSLLKTAMDKACEAHKAWSRTDVEVRAKALDTIADMMEAQMVDLMGVLSVEAGKSIPDAIAEVREAVDFCRYYANESRARFSKPIDLPGPTGERNRLSYVGRGPFLCISPWNFPLAIFTGQIVAALVSGNTVVAKPASQTSIIASWAVEIMHKAGIPKDVLHLVPSSGRVVGETLLTDPRLAGVCFTGSTATAQNINQTLASRQGAMIPFIAETGGQNAMIVDSTALPEQVVTDVVASAFQSAGQRCSALRLLCLQEEIADSVISMLKGAMDNLVVGDPRSLATDVGPVIDAPALEALQDHCVDLKGYAREIHTVHVEETIMQAGYFCPPTAYELKNLDRLTQEHFGPILHVIRYKAKDLKSMVESINNLGYGLTFGLHTRIQSRVEEISEMMDVGNVYVNRNMIGAVVGVQPFGGQGLSGTGPKAGGPNYLTRFVHEKTISIDTTAQGGNTTLMSLAK